MTSKEFRMWLEGFLTTLNLDNVEIRKYHETYKTKKSTI